MVDLETAHSIHLSEPSMTYNQTKTRQYIE